MVCDADIRVNPYLMCYTRLVMAITPNSNKGEAAALATVLGGRRCGRRWLARCPAHDNRRPSLSIARNRASAGGLSRFRIKAASTSVRGGVANRSAWQRDLMVGGRDAGRLEMRRKRL